MSIERNISRLEHSHLSVVVGGIIEAALQADVTIQCPVKGKYGHFQCGGVKGGMASLLLPGDVSWQFDISDLSLIGLKI